jgi:hypothetical protein
MKIKYLALSVLLGLLLSSCNIISDVNPKNQFQVGNEKYDLNYGFFEKGFTIAGVNNMNFAISNLGLTALNDCDDDCNVIILWLGVYSKKSILSNQTYNISDNSSNNEDATVEFEIGKEDGYYKEWTLKSGTLKIEGTSTEDLEFTIKGTTTLGEKVSARFKGRFQEEEL